MAVPLPGCGIGTAFPFALEARTVIHKMSAARETPAPSHTRSSAPHRRRLSPSGLGSTDSCATAVHTKPFSTSVLQVLAEVFATTTKICADGGSRRARAQSFCAHRRDPPTRRGLSLRRTRRCDALAANGEV